MNRGRSRCASPCAPVRRAARRHRGQLRILPAQDRRRWRRRCGSRSRRWRRCTRASSRSPMAPADRRASGPTPRSRGSCARPTLCPAAHLTCVGASRDEIDDIARSYWDAGRAPHRRAARRSARAGPALCARIPHGYANAAELVAGLKAVAPFEISVAAYPEVHPDQRLSRQRSRQSHAQDRRRRRPRDHPVLLLGRQSSSASATGSRRAGSISRSCRASCRCRTSPRRASSPAMCGAAIPDWMDRLFEGLDDLPAARQLVAATVAGELCGQLYAGGVRQFHFYTLNRAELAYAICHLLGVSAAA